MSIVFKIAVLSSHTDIQESQELPCHPHDKIAQTQERNEWANGVL